MKLPDGLEDSLKEILEDRSVEEKYKQIARMWLQEIRKKGKKTCILQRSLYGLKQSANGTRN